ncbi:peptidase S8/S53 domain-containing protein, partial [Thamnocephalis sphaerospora]
YHYPASGGAGVKVYVVDTGINVDHEDLQGRAQWGANVGQSAGSLTVDEQGHGTFVAGIVAGTRYGVAKNATVIAVKVLDHQGLGTTSDVLRGLSWVLDQHLAADHQKTVVNLSLGSTYTRATNMAVEQVIKAGIVVVVAAGNGNENLVPQNACDYSPSSSEHVITVGATDPNDKFASFSNYGRCVSIMAPGIQVTSLSSANNTGTVSMSGTSFAAPHVTGVVALLLGEAGPMPPAEVKQRLMNAATQGSIKGLLAGDGTPNLLLYSAVDMSPSRSGASHTWPMPLWPLSPLLLLVVNLLRLG